MILNSISFIVLSRMKKGSLYVYFLWKNKSVLILLTLFRYFRNKAIIVDKYFHNLIW